MLSSDSINPLFVRASRIEEVSGLSKTTIWRLEQVGKFPKRRKIGEGCVGWLYSEIKEWSNSCEKTL